MCGEIITLAFDGLQFVIICTVFVKFIPVELRNVHLYFMFCWPCVSLQSLQITNLTHSSFSCMFISILYMFRTAMCPSSGELIVSLRHLVYVTVCRCFNGTAVPSKPAYEKGIYTEWHIPDVVLMQLILLLMDTQMFETCKGKVVPLQAWSSPEDSWKLSFPDFMTTTHDGGKFVSLTHRPPLPPRVDARAIVLSKGFYVNEKFQWHHLESNQRPSDL